MDNYVSTIAYKGKSPFTLTYDGKKAISLPTSVSYSNGYTYYSVSSTGTVSTGNKFFGYGINTTDGYVTINVGLGKRGNESIGSSFTIDYRGIGNNLEAIGRSVLYGLENAHWEILIGGLAPAAGGVYAF